MSSAVRNSKTPPPAIWNAGIEIPIARSNPSPKSANTAKTIAEITTARRPIRRRSRAFIPWVSATNIGARPIGSTITKSVAKAVIRLARSIGGVSSGGEGHRAPVHQSQLNARARTPP